MAEQTQTGEQGTKEKSNGGGSNGGKAAVRAAAIAAATGATAIAAKKAFSGRGDQARRSRQKPEGGQSGGDDSMLGAMIGSGWGAARDSLLPFAEDAAEAAGEWVGRNGPELVRDTLVPRFVSGFERARESSGENE